MGVGVNTDNIIVRLKNVNFQRNGDAILEEVNAEVTGHGICLVMGPNGSGKTSLLRVMNGLEKMQSGEIIWHTQSHSLRGNRSLVFQSPVLMRRNVIENVAYPQLLRGETREIAYGRARRVMQNLGLGTHENLMAHNLSGGEKQKMALARALIVEPQVLFLDEPTANIDDQSTLQIENMLCQIADKGTCVIMASHDRAQAKRIAESIVFIHQGKVLEYGEATQMMKEPKSQSAKIYFEGGIVG